MIIIISYSAPNNIRGFLKRWFIEAKPNVFISSISSSQVHKIVQFVDKNCPNFSYLVIANTNTSQGFKLIDKTHKNIVQYLPEGYCLIPHNKKKCIL